MSGEQGGKKGKGRGRNRRSKGRGNQPRQSESTPPGGLQEQSVEKREEGTAQASALQTQPEQGVRETAQQAVQERSPSPPKQTETKQQTQPQSEDASSQPVTQPSSRQSKRKKGGKKKAGSTSVATGQQPTSSVSEQQSPTAQQPVKASQPPTGSPRDQGVTSTATLPTGQKPQLATTSVSEQQSPAAQQHVTQPPTGPWKKKAAPISAAPISAAPTSAATGQQPPQQATTSVSEQQSPAAQQPVTQQSVTQPPTGPWKKKAAPISAAPISAATGQQPPRRATTSVSEQQSPAAQQPVTQQPVTQPPTGPWKKKAAPISAAPTSVATGQQPPQRATTSVSEQQSPAAQQPVTQQSVTQPPTGPWKKKAAPISAAPTSVATGQQPPQRATTSVSEQQSPAAQQPVTQQSVTQPPTGPWKKKAAPISAAPISAATGQQPPRRATTSVSEQQSPAAQQPVTQQPVTQPPTGPWKKKAVPTSAATGQPPPQQATTVSEQQAHAAQQPVKASQPTSGSPGEAKIKTVPTKGGTRPTTGQQPQQATAKPQASATQQPVQPSQPSQLSTKAVRPPRRPDGGGKSGRPINLRVNFLRVTLPKEDIHHYDAEIKAKGVKAGLDGYTKSEAPRIIQEIVKEYEKANPRGPKLVYDKNGKNIYCRSPIPGIEKDRRSYNVLFTTDNGKEREYTVEVKWVSQVSLYYLNEALEGKHTEIPNDTIQAIDVVLRFLPSMTSIPVGASFFSFPDGHEKDLGSGLQIWNGTFVSIRPTEWKMMLNVDTASTAFYKSQPVLHFMCEFLGFQRIPNKLDHHQTKRFGKEMKTIKIETTYIKRKQRVSGLSRNSSKKEIFDCDGKMMSVFDYFKTKYSITLKYPDLPCLKIGQKGSCVPIELCNIVQGQRKQGRLTARQTQEMIKYTAIPAPQRQQEISKMIASAKFDQDPYCRDFGIKVSQDMVKITGRVLDPPVINFGPKERPVKETPRDGAWNMQQKAMYQPVELKEWALVSYENPQFLDDRAVDNFIRKLSLIADEKGIRMHHSPCHRTTKRGYEGIGQLFVQLHRDYPNLQLIIVIFPSKGSTDEYYEEVKHYGDVIYGIRTQCIKAQNARKADMQTMANICLKINAKLGGTTSILDKGVKSPILCRPVIIFGADVTHPSPRDVTTPSIAAVVASMDSHPNLYSAEVRVQKHRQEMIEELKDMVKVLLKKFRGCTGVKPEKILFYRDGVSEGQFKDVLIHELQAIQRACLELDPSFKPCITFIVVQKRHHTKIFAENPRDQRGKSRNIPAGTVVDRQICHPFEFDWYLCSHAGIQGTSKPAHYHVLYDDSNFKSDDLQILTNQLCHTYVRCPRAVSIPAPAYYAHHVAFRARYHLSEVDRGSSDGSVASGDTGANLGEDEMIRAVKIHDNMISTMYFA